MHVTEKICIELSNALMITGYIWIKSYVLFIYDPYTFHINNDKDNLQCSHVREKKDGLASRLSSKTLDISTFTVTSKLDQI